MAPLVTFAARRGGENAEWRIVLIVGGISLVIVTRTLVSLSHAFAGASESNYGTVSKNIHRQL
jgi:hypothetical protein